LLCADTEITHGDAAKSHEQKIFRVDDNDSLLVIAYSGSVPFAKMFIEDCCESFHNLTDKSKRAIRNYVSERLKSFHSSHIYPHPSRGYSGGPDFSLIVGIESKIDGLDFFSTNDCAVNNIEGFQCIGIGEYLARYIIQQDFRFLLPREDAERIAEKAIEAAKWNIPACGGSHQIVFLGEGRGEKFSR
jgi:20S proteasome alpha/beta subunit